MYPKKFEALVECYRRLPGVGIKTAERYAFQTLEWDEETMNAWISAFENVKDAETFRKTINVISVMIIPEIVKLFVSCRVQKMLSQWKRQKSMQVFIMF